MRWTRSIAWGAALGAIALATVVLSCAARREAQEPTAEELLQRGQLLTFIGGSGLPHSRHALRSA